MTAVARAARSAARLNWLLRFCQHEVIKCRLVLCRRVEHSALGLAPSKRVHQCTAETQSTPGSGVCWGAKEAHQGHLCPATLASSGQALGGQRGWPIFLSWAVSSLALALPHGASSMRYICIDIFPTVSFLCIAPCSSCSLRARTGLCRHRLLAHPLLHKQDVDYTQSMWDLCCTCSSFKCTCGACGAASLACTAHMSQAPELRHQVPSERATQPAALRQRSDGQLAAAQAR